MKKRSKILACTAGVIGVLAIVAAVNHETVRMSFHNLTAPTLKLDESRDWDGGTSYEKLQYSQVSENDYVNLYVPETEEPAPLFVLVHGGGFVSNDCESRQAQFMYRYFRDHGYACASVNYRLAQEAAYPAAVDDVKAAIRFLKANADTYGYNADRVALWGESAGGYLAVLAGTTSDEDFHGVSFIGEEDLKEPVNADVDLVVDFYGCIALGEMEADFKELKIPGIFRKVANLWMKYSLKDTGYSSVESYWVRKALEECSGEEREQYSAAYYIERNKERLADRKFIIWHGDADLTVPYLQSQKLEEHVSETLGDGSAEFRTFRNYKHADDRFYSDESLAQLKEQIDAVLSAQ